MKSLRDYKLTVTGNEHEAITWGTAFNPPIYATVNGLPVRVLTIGDLPGASPVYNCVDATGFSTLVKQTDVQIIDGAYLPLKDETLAPSTR
jgi:hypothetical protein